MPNLKDGQTTEMQGSGSRPYVLKNIGGVYSCSCPAWRNQSIGIERRSCKHLRKLRGDAAEETRIGSTLPAKPVASDNEAKAPALLLAESWDGVLDPTDWLLSEKLDGVRAYWDGARFLSRNGNVYHAPDWFIADLPSVPLDGELWIGRKQFQRTVSIVRRQDKNDLWKEVLFVVFDAPGIDQGFEKRLAFLRENLKTDVGFIRTLPQYRCHGIDHLRQELARLEALGAEGVMLRRPGSRYEGGRSATLLKVKSFRDAEARVIEHQEGGGRHKGRLGAFLCEMENGTKFAVGTGLSDAERENPPAVGSMITYRYQELSDGGVPRFPSYVGVREVAVASAQASKPPQDAAAILSSPGPHRFEFRKGVTQKYWEILSAGNTVTIRFGRIGTRGRFMSKSFADETDAAKHATKLIREKTGKGYGPVSS